MLHKCIHVENSHSDDTKSKQYRYFIFSTHVISRDTETRYTVYYRNLSEENYNQLDASHSIT